MSIPSLCKNSLKAGDIENFLTSIIHFLPHKATSLRTAEFILSPVEGADAPSPKGSGGTGQAAVEKWILGDNLSLIFTRSPTISIQFDVAPNSWHITPESKSFTPMKA